MFIYYMYYGIITILFLLLIQYKYAFWGKFKICQKQLIDQMQHQMKFFLIIASGLLLLIIGCRSDHQGGDLYNSSGTGYFYTYHKINEDSVPDIIRNFITRGNAGDFRYANFAIGFVLFCRLLGVLWGNQQVLLLGCAVLSIAPVGWFIYKSSKNKWLSVVLFIAIPCFATTLFSGIRQGIALGIIAMSYEFVREKKLLSFIILVLFACTFHSSAIVAFVAYPAYHSRIDRRSAFFGGVIVLAIIYLIKIPLFWILARAVRSDLVLLENSSINLFLILTFIYVLCTLFCKQEDYETRGYINIFWLACAAQAFSSLHTLVSRVTWYFLMILIVLLPNLLENMNIKEKEIIRPIRWIVGGVAVFLGLYYLKSNSMAQAYPYIPFWAAN